MNNSFKSPTSRADQNGVIRQIMGGSSIRSLSKENRTVEFVASDGSVDSYGTVLPVDKWDLRRYQKNGLVGYQHSVYGGDKGSDPDDIIGKGEARIENGQLLVKVTFEPADLNPKAEKIFRKVLFGTLNGVSVGFQPTKKGHFGDSKKGEDPKVYYYEGQELLEVSVVNIPANANAVKRGSAKPVRKANVVFSPKEKRLAAKVEELLNKQRKNDERRIEKEAERALIMSNALAALDKQNKLNH